MAGVFTHRLGAFRSVVVPAPTFTGALVYRSGTDYGSSPIEWNAESYDTSGSHDNSANPSRITIGQAALVRAIANQYSTNNNPTIFVQKDGSGVRGGGRTSTGTNGDNTVNVGSAPLVVAGGSYLEVGATGDTVANVRSWFAVEVLDPTIKRALVYKSGTQSLSAGVTTTLTWDSEEYDTDAFHDNSSNNSRLTVPSGVTLVRLTSSINTAAVAGQLVLSLIKNGANFQGSAAKDCETSGDDSLFMASPPLEVSSGDYFEVQGFSTNAATVQAGVDAFFSIEEVPATIKRCLAYRSTTQSFTSGVAAAIQWNAEVYDTDSIHDNSTNPSRFTAPSGVTEGRLSFNLSTASIINQQVARGLLNGSIYVGTPAMETDTAGGDNLNAMGAWVPVSPGDYFEVEFVAGANTSGFNNERSWACAEFR